MLFLVLFQTWLLWPCAYCCSLPPEPREDHDSRFSGRPWGSFTHKGLSRRERRAPRQRLNYETPLWLRSERKKQSLWIADGGRGVLILCTLILFTAARYAHFYSSICKEQSLMLSRWRLWTPWKEARLGWRQELLNSSELKMIERFWNIYLTVSYWL